MRRLVIAVLAVCLLAPSAAQACTTDAPPDPGVPTWQEVNGFTLGSRKATVDEVQKYVEAVAAATPDRTRLTTLATSVSGRPLQQLVVTAPQELDRLGETAATMRSLRRGEPEATEAAAIADDFPAIAWISSNVHGNEPSGTDGSMRLLYELVAGRTCANLARLRSVVTVFLPTQNPDGRQANTRTNANGFDMNRDWFARTQPETEGKLDAIRELPPILYIDAHEQGGVAGFFPPNADPIHHEISDQALTHINEVYGPAMRDAADEAGFDYTNYTTYDLFFMGFGDTVPATAFGSAGMTFEKGSSSPYSEKTFEQYTTQNASLNAAAARKPELLRDWAASFREARAQGAAGELEPNVVVQPTNTVRFPVPEQPVFGYALRADEHRGDVVKLVRRLQALDVEVARLTEAVTVPGLDRFGAGAVAPAELPAGTFVVSMAQAQKHWVQALLGEDAFVPFPYFYDVSSWSNPLLMGLQGGALTTSVEDLPLERLAEGALLGGVTGSGPALSWAGDSTGAERLAITLLRGGAKLSRVPGTGTFWATGADREAVDVAADELGLEVRAAETTPAAAAALSLPKVALLGSGQGASFARFSLEEQLGLDVDVLGTTASLDGYDVAIVSGSSVTSIVGPAQLLGLQLLARRGGTVIAYGAGGVTAARAAGLTTALPRPPGASYEVPGASFAMRLDPQNPVAWGMAPDDFLFNVGDQIIEPGTSTGAVVGAYPSGAAFFQGGYAEGTEVLQGTPAILDETVGAGRAVLLTFDPMFRSYTEAGLRLIGNAILRPRAPLLPSPAGVARAVDPSLLRTGAQGGGRDMVVRVDAADAAVLERLVPSLPRGARIDRTLRSATLRIPNPSGTDPHGRGEVPRVLGALSRAGVEPMLVVL